MTGNLTTRNLGRSAFWSVVNQSLGQILVFGVFLITARFVSKEAFGILAAAMLAIELFRQIFIESIGTTFYAKKAPTPADYNAGFCIILVGGLLSGLFMLLFAGPIAAFFGHSDIAGALRWMSVLLLTTGLSKMHEIWLTKHLAFKVLAIRSVTSIVVGGGVGIAMAVRGYGIESLIAQQVVTAVISLIWLWSATAWRPTSEVHWENVVALLRYARFVALNSTASMLSNQGDVLLSSYYLGPAATGAYNAAKRLLTAIALIVNSGLNSVALPVFASISDDASKFQRSFLACVNFTAIFTAPLFVGLAVLAPDIIRVLMGDKWADVAPVLAILAVTGFTRSINQYSANILLIKQKAHWLTVIGFVDAGVNILVLFFFAQYGLNYLAAAFAVKTILFSPLVTQLALRLIAVKSGVYLGKIVPPILFALVMGALLWYARHAFGFNSLANILVLVPLGVAVYLAMIALFDRAALTEGRGFLRQALARRHTK